MILIAPARIFKAVFRRMENIPDNQGGERKAERMVATGRKLEDGSTLSGAVTRFGTPTREEGVNARVAFSHRWSEDELRWLREVFIPSLDNPSPRNEIYLTDKMPDDWRYPREDV